MIKRNLYVRAPMFDPSGGKVGDRVWAFDLWWDENEESIVGTFGITLLHPKGITPRRKLGLKGGIKIEYPSDERATVAKGLAIRLELIAILDTVRSADLKHSYFVQIDGSAAIDYGSIRLVLEELLESEEQPEVVLGRRPHDSPDWFMGHPERKAIELFEKSLIEERYQTTIDKEFEGTLPDAQAGCWGLRMDVLKKLSLTAGGYELEFDVITSALELLEHGLLGSKKVAFTREELSCGPRIGGGGGSGTFQLNPVNTIDKLPFFLHKLGYEKSNIEEFLNTYRVAHELPQEYVFAVQEWKANQ